MESLVEAKKKAIDLLSRREHTRRELEQKLGSRGFEWPVINSVLEELIKKNYQNDRRFAELFVEQRIQKGFGPIKIRSELYNRGIESEVAEHALQRVDVDWVCSAKSVMKKKLRVSGAVAADHVFLNKCRRFLYSRGFSQEQIRDALN